jgi:hypothetical protein
MSRHAMTLLLGWSVPRWCQVNPWNDTSPQRIMRRAAEDYLPLCNILCLGLAVLTREKTHCDLKTCAKIDTLRSIHIWHWYLATNALFYSTRKLFILHSIDIKNGNVVLRSFLFEYYLVKKDAKQRWNDKINLILKAERHKNCSLKFHNIFL